MQHIDGPIVGGTLQFESGAAGDCTDVKLL